ncbi:neuronal acetylcholine receptor subunit alpha-9-II-like [Branchiostoma floridae x Branchiostoma belcheri]
MTSITSTVFVFVLSSLTYSVTGVSEKEVADRILTGYQKDGRPLQNPAQAVLLSLDVSQLQIIKLDAQRQVITINFWLWQRWRDDFLTWNPADFGNITSISLKSEEIWRPVLVNYNREHEDGWSDTPDTNAIVRSNGEVHWAYPITIHSTCVLDIARFPFDVQRCLLKFGSWEYDETTLKLVNYSDTGRTNRFVENGEWTLLSFDHKINQVEYSCCPGVLWDDITFTITLKRRSTYFIFYILSPSVILAFMAVCGFWLPPHAGSRLSLCITLMLTLSVFLQVVNGHLPDSATSIPLMNVFFGATIILVSASSALTIVILSLHFKTFDPKPVPGWLRCIFCLGPPPPNVERTGRKVRILNPPVHTERVERPASFVTDRVKATMQLVRRARRILQQLREDYDKRVRKEKIEKEWKILAEKIDKCLLVAFFVSLVVITGVFLGFENQ